MLKGTKKVVPLRCGEQHRIECADNIEFMRDLEKESMHLIVTSPPYNIGKEYESRTSLDHYIEHQAATIAEAGRSRRCCRPSLQNSITASSK